MQNLEQVPNYNDDEAKLNSSNSLTNDEKDDFQPSMQEPQQESVAFPLYPKTNSTSPAPQKRPDKIAPANVDIFPDINFEDLQPVGKPPLKVARPTIQAQQSVSQPAAADPKSMTLAEEIQLAFALFKTDVPPDRRAAEAEIEQMKKVKKQAKPSPKRVDPDSTDSEPSPDKQTLDEQIMSMPKQKFHMPKRPSQDPVDHKRFVKELVSLLCCFESRGTVSEQVVSRFKQSQMVATPPTIHSLISDISENTSYREEKLRFLRNKKSLSMMSLNVSQSFSGVAGGRMANFSLMNDLGDVLLNYGKTTGFKCLVPNRCAQASFNELKTLFEKVMPRQAFGITVTAQQLQQFNRDCFLQLTFSINELDALFARAVFCQNKYILDYIGLNPVKTMAQSKKVQVINFDFLEYSNDVISAQKPDYDILAGGKNLCYIGFLQYIYICSLEIIKKKRPYYLMELPAATFQKDVEEEEESENDSSEQLLKNYEMAKKNTSYKRVVSSIRNPYANVISTTKIDDIARPTENQTFAPAWKSAFAFACYLDCYVLRFARRYGITQRNEHMEKSLADNKEWLQIAVKYRDGLQALFNSASQGSLYVTADGLYKILQKTSVLEKISKAFLFEYTLRNFMNYDGSFIPVLSFDEVLNSIFVAANLAFSVHPYVLHLKTPGLRFLYAIENAVGSK